MSAMRYALRIVVFFLPLVPATTLAADVGDLAPDFLLPSVQNPQQAVSPAPARGRLLYLDFWSAWCLPCREKMQLLAELNRRHANLEVIGINVDALVSDARRFLEDSAPGYPSAFDPGAQVAARYGVTAVPAGYLIDERGIIRSISRTADASSVRELEDRVNALATVPVKLVEEIP